MPQCVYSLSRMSDIECRIITLAIYLGIYYTRLCVRENISFMDLRTSVDKTKLVSLFYQMPTPYSRMTEWVEVKLLVFRVENYP